MSWVRADRPGLVHKIRPCKRFSLIPLILQGPTWAVEMEFLMDSQKVVKKTICQCNFTVLLGVPAAVERFLRNRQFSLGNNYALVLAVPCSDNFLTALGLLTYDTASPVACCR